MSEITQQMWDELNEKYEQLRLHEEMYRVAMSLTDHTISVVDIPNRSLNQIYNEGDWTGIAATMEDAPESIIATGIIHPDDCDGYRSFYQDIYSGKPKGEFTMRVMEENRGWVWFTMYYKTVFDEAGKPVRAICFSDDITIEKMAEQRYINYKNTVTSDAEYVWEANITQDTLIDGDTSTSAVFGDETFTTYTELTERATDIITDPVLRAQAKQLFSRKSLLNAYSEAKRELALEYPSFVGIGEGIHWMRATAHIMVNSVSDIIAIFCVNDITETHNRIQSLERQAERDALTGLYNRSSFEKRATNILNDYPEKLHGFMMIDIDNFKSCNDTYGHAFGDSVLQMFANVSQSVFRNSDLLGRVGGDEFMVVMQNAGSIDIVLQRAKDLQMKFKAAAEALNVPLNITLSIGISLSECNDDYQNLYLKADSLMYTSKKTGKNRINVEEKN